VQRKHDRTRLHGFPFEEQPTNLPIALEQSENTMALFQRNPEIAFQLTLTKCKILAHFLQFITTEAKA
jgi:hypothetical protein